MNSPIAAELLENIEGREKPVFQEYLRILSRHRYSLIGLTLLFALLGGLLAAMDVPIFRSTAMLLIDREAARYVEVQEVYGVQSQGYEYYQTQYELLKTYPLAERTADLVGPQKIIDASNRQSAFSLGRLFGLKPATPKTLTAAEQRARAANIIRGSLQVSPVRGSQLVRISVDSADPEVAVAVANAHGRSYIDSMLEARVDMVGQATSFLSGRTARMRKELEEAENALEDFKRREGLVEASMGAVPSQEMSLVSTQLNVAQADRLAREALFGQVSRALKTNSSLESITGLSTDPRVEASRQQLADARKRQAELATRYGPQHPEIQAVKAEIEEISRNLNLSLRQAADLVVSNYETARQLENQLRAQYEGARSQLQSISSKSVELNRLERDLEAKRLVYDKFQTQFNETSGVKGLDTASARLVEAAAGANKVHPNVRRSAMTAAIFGLFLAIALAFLLDHLDNTIKTTEDVERRLQAPVLGLVPTIKTSGKKDTSPLRYFLENPKTGFAEALRTARTNILLSSLNKQHRKLLITSSVPSEGKTTTTLNLAQALSQLHKVLVIDADMRRPSVNRVFPVGQAPAVGLSQFISGEAKISECVHQLDNHGPYIMTAGVAPPNPLELLSSTRFSEALDSLSRVFDFVLIDCAPTLAVSDALVLAKLVDGVIYVVMADSTPYQAAQSGIRRLRRIDAPLMGVILNRIGLRPHGYGYGRYSYYAEGYAAYGSYYQGETKRRPRKA